MTSPPPTGPQSITVQCWSGDGSSVTATLAYDGGTGAPTSLVVVNTSSRPAPVVLTVGGTDQTVSVKAGTHTYRGSTITGWGLTDVNAQLGNVSAASP